MTTPVVYNPIPVRFRPFSGSVLKICAVVTMLIDHIGAGILYPFLLLQNAFFDLTREQSILVYRVFRGIGRAAFPIYCFLLVEGFFIPGTACAICCGCSCSRSCRRSPSTSR